MKRLPFTHLMFEKALSQEKTETRRMSVRSYWPGEWVLMSCNYWRPINPAHFSPACLHVVHSMLRNRLNGCLHSGSIEDMPGDWRPAPSIHMPCWAAYGAVQIVTTRLSTLDAITDAGAKREGFKDREAFMAYFDRLNKNPDHTQQVQVIEFKAYSMEAAQAHGGLAELTLTPAEHWPDDWAKGLPSWLRSAKVVQASRSTA